MELEAARQMSNANTYDIDDLTLDEVSAVDDPANQLSLMALWKRAPEPQGDDVMDINEIKKSLEASDAKVTDLTKSNADLQKSLDAAKAEKEALMKALEGADITVEAKDGEFSVAKAAEPEYIDVDGEKVLKSTVPAPLLKRMEAQAADIAELKKAASDATLAKRAEQMFPNLGGSAAEKGALVKMLDGLEGDEKTSLEKSLKAADAAVAKMFNEVGDGSAKTSEASEQLDAMVAKHAEENNVTKAVAYTTVVKSGEGRKLLLKSRAEAN